MKRGRSKSGEEAVSESKKYKSPSDNLSMSTMESIPEMSTYEPNEEELSKLDDGQQVLFKVLQGIRHDTATSFQQLQLHDRRISANEETITDMQSKIDRLERQNESLYNESRNHNIRIIGLSEDLKPFAELQKCVKNIITEITSKLGTEKPDNCPEVDQIQRDYKTRSNVGGRPVIVTFLRKRERDLILRNAYKVREQLFNGCKVRITDDVGPETRRQHYELSRVMESMLDQNYYAIMPFEYPRCIRYSTRRWNKNANPLQKKPPMYTYTYQDLLNKRPFAQQSGDENAYNPRNTSKSPIILEDRILFLGKESGYSNWAEKKFVLDDTPFPSVEHKIVRSYAIETDNQSLADKVLATKEPSDVKKLLTEVKWGKVNKHDVDIATHAFNGMLAKFTQNPDMKELILSTDLELIEATRDRVWGCGFHLSDDKIRNRSLYYGENLCGRLLMGVRNVIRRNMTYVHVKSLPMKRDGSLFTVDIPDIDTQASSTFKFSTPSDIS
jgi:hypothetical protein